MTTVFDDHDEHVDGDRCVIFLDDDREGGIVLHGYDNDVTAMLDILMHVRAVFQANDKRVDLMFVDENGITRLDGSEPDD